MKIKPFTSLTRADLTPMQYFYNHMKLLVLFCGLALYGCSRFESDQARGHAQQALKQLASSGQKCAKDRACDCEQAVADASAKKVSPSGLVAKLDDTLSQTKEFKRWPLSGTGRCQRQLPYHFTVISVSPLLVIGSPVKSLADANCSASDSPLTCLRSKRFAGNYEIANKFTHTPGLVWFSPEHGPRLFDVPQHAKSMYLLINGKSLRLKRKGNQWMFSRKQ